MKETRPSKARYCGAQTAADMLGISRQTLVRAVTSGKYRLTVTETPGGHRRFDVAEIEQLVELRAGLPTPTESETA